MNRDLPGVIAVEGREFLYVEEPEQKAFHSWMENVFSETPEIPAPVSGGVIEERASVQLKDGTRFDALSYKGDVMGWRKKICGFCDKHGKLTGEIIGDKLKISDGRLIPLSKCKIRVE